MTDDKEYCDMIENMKPIGFIDSCYKEKNGTPRQPNMCPLSRAKIEISKSTFTNPSHSLIGLENFSHVWILFLFHRNGNDRTKPPKAKISPPRLNGKKIGVFSSRSPHRPNPIGLSLVKLERLHDDTVYLNGVDMLHGTPVFDIKPYIPSYDQPKLVAHLNHPGDTSNQESHCVQEVFKEISTSADDDDKTLGESLTNVRVADWLENNSKIEIVLTNRAEKQLQRLMALGRDKNEARRAIVDALCNDPRSVYRKQKCQDRLYFCYVDNFHVTCWFDDEENVCEVLKIRSANRTLDERCRFNTQMT
ncbi:C9orf156 (predicted) [Pycnogonum litorale]